MENINLLICYVLAIANFSKDIHYSVHGEAFYGKHLLADRIQEGLYEYIDKLKETCLLGNDIQPENSIYYLEKAADLIPLIDDANDKYNFEMMKELLIETLSVIQEIKDYTRGEQSLIDDIAKDLQQKLGLVNLQVRE